MDKTKLRCNVVMLSTEEKAEEFVKTKNRICFDSHLKELTIVSYPNRHRMLPQHLYFTSKREIKEGDNMLLKNNHPKGRLRKCFYIEEDQLMIDNPKDENRGYGFCKHEEVWKIEATTDQSLGLPLIPQSFVEKYVEKRGNIKEVMIEMEYLPGYRIEADPMVHGEKVKVRKDGTVICSPVKDMWTREEVIEKMKRSIEQAFIYPKTFATGICLDTNMTIKWIEENI